MNQVVEWAKIFLTLLHALLPYVNSTFSIKKEPAFLERVRLRLGSRNRAVLFGNHLATVAGKYQLWEVMDGVEAFPPLASKRTLFFQCIHRGLP